MRTWRPHDVLTPCSLPDCDGVVWRGNEAIKGASSTLQELRRAGKKCVFVSNATTKTRHGFVSKFASLGIDNQVQAADVYNPAMATPRWLQQRGISKVYLIGEGGILDEMADAGIEVLGSPHDDASYSDQAGFGDIELDDSVQAVVAAQDSRFNFFKLAMASLYLTRPGKDTLFVSTHPDVSVPVAGGRCVPEGGVMAAAIASAIGRAPDEGRSKHV